MERLEQSGGNATKSFSRVLVIQSSLGIPGGRNTNSKPNPATLIGDRPSSRRTSRGLIGKSGLLPWRRLVNTHGHCILFGNFCITIRLRCPFSPVILSRISLLITFGRGFIVTASLPRATKHGGFANRLASGCLHYQKTIRSFDACSKK